MMKKFARLNSLKFLAVTLCLGSLASTTFGQGAGDSTPPNGRVSLLRRLRSRIRGKDEPGEIRLVQATSTDDPPAPPPPPANPAQLPGDVPGPGVREGGDSTATNNDLSLPRAEREGGGGEPTAVAAAADEAPKKDPTKLLMNALGREDKPVKVYGWIQNSYTGNTNGVPKSRANFGVNPNNLANSWMGNQYYLIIEKTLDLSKPDELQFGFRVDNLFGNDWQFNHMHGLFNTSFNVNHFAGYDPAQMYAEVHLPILTKGGLDIKGGRWYTLAGYEVVPATGRPLLSVPYMFNYGQPFTHFGMISTLHLTDKILVYNGVINGWDRWIDQRYQWGYTGGFSWTFNEDKTTLTMITVQGPQQQPNFLPGSTLLAPTGSPPVNYLPKRANIGYGNDYRTLFTTVLSHKWSDRFTQIMETDQAIEKNIPGIGPGGTSQNAEWYSFGNWFLYDLFRNKDGVTKFTGVWRSEIFRDNNGVRTGLATNYTEFTVGGIWKPVPYIWVRPEARYDFVRSGHPYNDGTRSSQFTLAFDVILLF